MSDDASTPALVSPTWAQHHLDDPGVRFVEVDFDTEAYQQGHLPGAVGWNWASQLTDAVLRDIVGREALSELLSGSGIGVDTQIVLYGEDNWYAAWAFWQLGLFGVSNVSLIDGGRRYWLEHSLPLSADAPNHPAREIDLSEPDFSTRAFLRDIEARLGEPGLTPPPGYPDIAQRAGHIPGAVSAPWEEAVNEDGTFKSADELRAHYAA